MKQLMRTGFFLGFYSVLIYFLVGAGHMERLIPFLTAFSLHYRHELLFILANASEVLPNGTVSIYSAFHWTYIWIYPLVQPVSSVFWFVYWKIKTVHCKCLRFLKLRLHKLKEIQFLMHILLDMHHQRICKLTDVNLNQIQLLSEKKFTEIHKISVLIPCTFSLISLQNIGITNAFILAIQV